MTKNKTSFLKRTLMLFVFCMLACAASVTASAAVLYPSPIEASGEVSYRDDGTPVVTIHGAKGQFAAGSIPGGDGTEFTSTVVVAHEAAIRDGNYIYLDGNGVLQSSDTQVAGSVQVQGDGLENITDEKQITYIDQAANLNGATTKGVFNFTFEMPANSRRGTYYFRIGGAKRATRNGDVYYDVSSRLDENSFVLLPKYVNPNLIECVTDRVVLDSQGNTTQKIYIKVNPGPDADKKKNWQYGATLDDYLASITELKSEKPEGTGFGDESDYVTIHKKTSTEPGFEIWKNGDDSYIVVDVACFKADEPDFGYLFVDYSALSTFTIKATDYNDVEIAGPGQYNGEIEQGVYGTGPSDTGFEMADYLNDFIFTPGNMVETKYNEDIDYDGDGDDAQLVTIAYIEGFTPQIKQRYLLPDLKGQAAVEAGNTNASPTIIASEFVSAYWSHDTMGNYKYPVAITNYITADGEELGAEDKTVLTNADGSNANVPFKVFLRNESTYYALTGYFYCVDPVTGERAVTEADDYAFDFVGQFLVNDSGANTPPEVTAPATENDIVWPFPVLEPDATGEITSIYGKRIDFLIDDTTTQQRAMAESNYNDDGSLKVTDLQTWVDALDSRLIIVKGKTKADNTEIIRVPMPAVTVDAGGMTAHASLDSSLYYGAYLDDNGNFLTDASGNPFTDPDQATPADSDKLHWNPNMDPKASSLNGVPYKYSFRTVDEEGNPLHRKTEVAKRMINQVAVNSKIAEAAAAQAAEELKKIQAGSYPQYPGEVVIEVEQEIIELPSKVTVQLSDTLSQEVEIKWAITTDGVEDIIDMGEKTSGQFGVNHRVGTLEQVIRKEGDQVNVKITGVVVDEATGQEVAYNNSAILRVLMKEPIYPERIEITKYPTTIYSNNVANPPKYVVTYRVEPPEADQTVRIEADSSYPARPALSTMRTSEGVFTVGYNGSTGQAKINLSTSYKTAEVDELGLPVTKTITESFITQVVNDADPIEYVEADSIQVYYGPGYSTLMSENMTIPVSVYGNNAKNLVDVRAVLQSAAGTTPTDNNVIWQSEDTKKVQIVPGADGLTAQLKGLSATDDVVGITAIANYGRGDLEKEFKFYVTVTSGDLFATGVQILVNSQNVAGNTTANAVKIGLGEGNKLVLTGAPVPFNAAQQEVTMQLMSDSDSGFNLAVADATKNQYTLTVAEGTANGAVGRVYAKVTMPDGSESVETYAYFVVDTSIVSIDSVDIVKAADQTSVGDSVTLTIGGAAGENTIVLDKKLYSAPGVAVANPSDVTWSLVDSSDSKYVTLSVNTDNQVTVTAVRKMANPVKLRATASNGVYKEIGININEIVYPEDVKLIQELATGEVDVTKAQVYAYPSDTLTFRVASSSDSENPSYEYTDWSLKIGNADASGRYDITVDPSNKGRITLAKKDGQTLNNQKVMITATVKKPNGDGTFSIVGGVAVQARINYYATEAPETLPETVVATPWDITNASAATELTADETRPNSYIHVIDSASKASATTFYIELKDGDNPVEAAQAAINWYSTDSNVVITPTPKAQNGRPAYSTARVTIKAGALAAGEIAIRYETASTVGESGGKLSGTIYIKAKDTVQTPTSLKLYMNGQDVTNQTIYIGDERTEDKTPFTFVAVSGPENAADSTVQWTSESSVSTVRLNFDKRSPETATKTTWLASGEEVGVSFSNGVSSTVAKEPFVLTASTNATQGDLTVKPLTATVRIVVQTADVANGPDAVKIYNSEGTLIPDKTELKIEGTSIQLQAEAIRNDGVLPSNNYVYWTSSNPDLVSVTPVTAATGSSGSVSRYGAVLTKKAELGPEDKVEIRAMSIDETIYGTVFITADGKSSGDVDPDDPDNPDNPDNPDDPNPSGKDTVTLEFNVSMYNFNRVNFAHDGVYVKPMLADDPNHEKGYFTKAERDKVAGTMSLAQDASGADLSGAGYGFVKLEGLDPEKNYIITVDASEYGYIVREIVLNLADMKTAGTLPAADNGVITLKSSGTMNLIAGNGTADVDGDYTSDIVNATDISRTKGVVGQKVGTSKYQTYYDYNKSDIIDATDYKIARENSGIKYALYNGASGLYAYSWNFQ